MGGAHMGNAHMGAAHMGAAHMGGQRRFWVRSGSKIWRICCKGCQKLTSLNGNVPKLMEGLSNLEFGAEIRQQSRAYLMEGLLKIEVPGTR